MHVGARARASALVLVSLAVTGCVSADAPQADISWHAFAATYNGENWTADFELSGPAPVLGADEVVRLAYVLDARFSHQGSLTFAAKYHVDSASRLVRLDYPCGYAPWSCHEAAYTWEYRGAIAPFGLALPGVVGPEGLVQRAPHAVIPVAATLARSDVVVVTVPPFEQDSTYQGLSLEGTWRFAANQLMPDRIRFNGAAMDMTSYTPGGSLPEIAPWPLPVADAIDRNASHRFPGLDDTVWAPGLTTGKALQFLVNEVPEARSMVDRGCIKTIVSHPQGQSPGNLLGMDRAPQYDFFFHIVGNGKAREWGVRYVASDPPQWDTWTEADPAGKDCLPAVANESTMVITWSSATVRAREVFPFFGNITMYTYNAWQDPDPLMQPGQQPIVSLLFAGTDVGQGLSFPYRVAYSAVDGTLFRAQIPPDAYPLEA